MKSKDEVFHCFKIFKAFVERESGRQIKMVRSDGGGEYKSNEFKRLCEELGLKHTLVQKWQTTTLYLVRLSA